MTERSLAELLRDLHHGSNPTRTQAARSLDTLLRRWGRNLGDDVVQSVWMKLLKKPELPAKLATMTGDKQEAYLRAMLRNTHRDRLKQEQKEKRRFWQPKNEDEMSLDIEAMSLKDVLEQYPAAEADLHDRSLSEQGDAVLRHGLALLAGVKPALALTTLGVDPSVQRSLNLFCGQLVPALADTYRIPAHREAFLAAVIDQWSLDMCEVTREALWERDREQGEDDRTVGNRLSKRFSRARERVLSALEALAVYSGTGVLLEPSWRRQVVEASVGWGLESADLETFASMVDGLRERVFDGSGS